MYLYLYLIVAILFIIVVLLQQKNADLGSLMGGGGDEIVTQRRGAESFLHKASVVLSVVLIAGGLAFMIWRDALLPTPVPTSGDTDLTSQVEIGGVTAEAVDENGNPVEVNIDTSTTPPAGTPADTTTQTSEIIELPSTPGDAS